MKSITLRVFLLMLGFGLLMGLIFPFFTKLFVDLPPRYVVLYGLCCVGAGLTVGLVNFFIVQRVILRFIRAMALKLGQMAESGMDHVEVISVDSPDAIGDLTRKFNVFLARLQGMVGRTRKRIDTSRQASVRLSKAMDDSHASIESAALATERLEKSMESQRREILAVGVTAAAQKKQGGVIETRLDQLVVIGGSAVQGYRRQAEDVARLKELLDAVTRGLTDMQQRTRGADGAGQSLKTFARSSRESMEQMTVRLKEVMTVSETIRTFVEVIGAVASQTKLLAMNASIEAAHAGAAGRGFAVVAQEIRKLSDSANRRADEARQALGRIQTTVEGSRDMVDKTRKDFDGCLDGFNRLGNELEGVLHTSEGIVKSIQEAAQVVHETDARSQAGIRDQEQARSLYSEVHGEAKAIQLGVAEVSSRLSTLDGITEEIKGVLAGVTDSMAVMQTAFQQVSILAQTNRDQLADLDLDLGANPALPAPA